MAETVDVRGLSCPQPVLDTLAKIKEVGSGVIEILVDSEASEENTTRAVQAKGWRVTAVSDEGDHHKLTITNA